MADFKFIGSELGYDAIGVVKDVKSGAASTIAYGDLFREDNVNAGYVKKCANGDTDSLTKGRVYFCTEASTETVGADGKVEGIWVPHMILEGTATTPAQLVQAVIDTRVTLDVSGGGAQTIDEDDTTNGFMRIQRPEGGASKFDTTNGYNTRVVVNEFTT